MPPSGTEALALCAEDVRFAYGQREVLRGVSLSVEPGEVLSLLGANGSGKTTLLRVLLGLTRPTAGAVTLAGLPLSRYAPRDLARRLAYVPQNHMTPFPYSVRDIAVLGRMPHTGLVRMPSARDHEVASEVLERLGIAHLAERPYTEISSGERQLTLIARALAQDARVIVMDEPVAGLDYGNQLRLLEHLRSLAAEGYAIVKTTHHPDHALMASTRVAVLCEGAIVLDGPPGEVVTAETIERVYHVRVSSFASPDGEATAFHPIGRVAGPG